VHLAEEALDPIELGATPDDPDPDLAHLFRLGGFWRRLESSPR
jgi:hypothetical protein